MFTLRKEEGFRAGLNVEREGRSYWQSMAKGKNRVKDIPHKVSKTIVEFAKVRRCGIILKDLRGIRKRIDYGRKLNRRLHSWSFQVTVVFGRLTCSLC